MKKVFRHEDNRKYWDRRWAQADHDADRFTNVDIYPIRYAELVMDDPTRHTLELGAGLGRVLKHYHYIGHRIIGLERSEIAVRRLQIEDAELDIRQGDVLDLPFADEQFDVVLAFGLYHNIECERDMNRALAETARCLRAGGRFSISMRPNNLEMRLNEWYWRWRQRHQPRGELKFHKWLVGEQEFQEMLYRHDLRTDQVHRARNVSLLYRLAWLRGRSADETERRAHGYQLNGLGRALDRVLVGLWPAQFCNVLVLIGTKEA